MRIVLHIPLALLASQAVAQAPILTSEDHPYPSLIATYAQSDDGLVIYDGPDQVWDLTWLWTGPPLVRTYSAPASTPGSSFFPEATLAVGTNQSSSFTFYYAVDEDGIHQLGRWYSDLNSATVYSDPVD